MKQEEGKQGNDLLPKAIRGQGNSIYSQNHWYDWL
jgi:hypothetical protein